MLSRSSTRNRRCNGNSPLPVRRATRRSLGESNLGRSDTEFWLRRSTCGSPNSIRVHHLTGAWLDELIRAYPILGMAVCHIGVAWRPTLSQNTPSCPFVTLLSVTSDRRLRVSAQLLRRFTGCRAKSGDAASLNGLDSGAAGLAEIRHGWLHFPARLAGAVFLAQERDIGDAGNQDPIGGPP